MSSTEAAEVCANCGKAEVDNTKLRKCTACKLVKYCSVDCQKSHRSHHKKACKKRAAEIRDDELFTQNEGGCYLGECPICCLPLPMDESKSGINSCCCKIICMGCDSANMKREREQAQHPRCPYCREELPDMDEEEIKQNYMERAKVNDPVAMNELGRRCYSEGDYEAALEYFTKAANLGYIDAHFRLSFLYCNGGQGVERDLKKKIYHLEKAAIGGHPNARYNLGSHEFDNGSDERAMKHFIIAAKLGLDGALEVVKESFRLGLVSKDDYAAALRGHQAAVDATKSEQREEAYRARQEGLLY